MLWGAITKSLGENRRNKQKNKVQLWPIPSHSSQYNGMPKEISTFHMARSPGKAPVYQNKIEKNLAGNIQLSTELRKLNSYDEGQANNHGELGGKNQNSPYLEERSRDCSMESQQEKHKEIQIRSFPEFIGIRKEGIHCAVQGKKLRTTELLDLVIHLCSSSMSPYSVCTCSVSVSISTSTYATFVFKNIFHFTYLFFFHAILPSLSLSSSPLSQSFQHLHFPPDPLLLFFLSENSRPPENINLMLHNKIQEQAYTLISSLDKATQQEIVLISRQVSKIPQFLLLGVPQKL